MAKKRTAERIGEEPGTDLENIDESSKLPAEPDPDPEPTAEEVCDSAEAQVIRERLWARMHRELPGVEQMIEALKRAGLYGIVPILHCQNPEFLLETERLMFPDAEDADDGGSSE